MCFERLDSPRDKVVDSPAYDGVVEHSHVDVDHTDSVTNLGKWKGGEDGWSKIKAKKYASPLSKLDRSSSKEIGSHIWLKHVIPIFIYQPWQLMFLRSLETVHHHTCGTGQGRVPCRKGGGLRTPAWWSMVSGRPLIWFWCYDKLRPFWPMGLLYSRCESPIFVSGYLTVRFLFSLSSHSARRSTHMGF